VIKVEMPRFFDYENNSLMMEDNGCRWDVSLSDKNWKFLVCETGIGQEEKLRI
jgi:hypothetical protein